MTREELLKECILTKYRSVREFCMQIDVPYSTVDSIFKRGIMVSSVSLIIKICDRLNIDVDELINGRISEKLPPLESLTLKERTLLHADRNNPGMQSAVDKLLGIEAPNCEIAEDICNTISAGRAFSKEAAIK